MPARRKPAKVLALSGAFDHNPQRKRDDPELDEVSSKPPAHLSPEAQEMWVEIVGLDNGLKNIKHYHAITLELLCVEMAEFRKNPAKVGAERLKNVRMLLKDFNMTPSDTSKLGVATGGKDVNPFDEFAVNLR